MNIAFIGKAGAGKTTCAELLTKNHGFERLSFAGPLKVGCASQTDRALLQRVGQGVRDLYEDFWVNLLLADMQDRDYEWWDAPGRDNGARFVIDDCRYPNEVQRLRGEGFVIVRVVAPTNLRIDRLRANGKLGDISELEHESETALDDEPHDYRIINDGWSDRLYQDVLDIVNRESR